jgi:hypothetical protein
MARYRITETAVYEVEADNAEEAEAVFLDSVAPNQFFSYVYEREVEAVRG